MSELGRPFTGISAVVYCVALAKVHLCKERENLLVYLMIVDVVYTNNSAKIAGEDIEIPVGRVKIGNGHKACGNFY